MMVINIKFMLMCWLLFLSLSDKSTIAEERYSQTDTTSIVVSQGYTDIVQFGGKYFAVGTDGRIDCISNSGERTTVDNSNKNKLNCAFSNDEILIAAGDHGTILYSYDGKKFHQAESRTNENINGITFKNGLILAGADKGIVLISKDGKEWNNIQTETKGNIMSPSANTSFFIGVTDVGEIMKSSDGTTWEIKDYNKEYAGFNEPAKFKKIIATPNSIVIIGTHNDGSPSILFSSLGNVWAERIPFYHDEQGIICYLTKKPNGITYDPLMDEIILACDNGELFSLPSCSKCNKYIKISETNFNAIIYDDNCLVIVGDEYSFFMQRL
jgi:hypothetical protein